MIGYPDPAATAPAADRSGWAAPQPGLLTLAVPGGQIVLEQELGSWAATLYARGRPPLVFARGLPVAYVQEMAKDLARRLERGAGDERS